MTEPQAEPVDDAGTPPHRGRQVGIIGDPAAISRSFDAVTKPVTESLRSAGLVGGALASLRANAALKSVDLLHASPAMKALAQSDQALRRVRGAGLAGVGPGPSDALARMPRVRPPASSDDIAALTDAVVALHSAAEAQALDAAVRDRAIVRLTWALVILTLVVATLTAVLVWMG